MDTCSNIINVEVVVPVHNRKNLTLQCLRSLFRTDQAGLMLHVILIDDGSIDGTSKEVHYEFPGVEIIQADGTLWYTGATNRGIKSAMANSPDYILAINNDQVFHRESLLRMVNCAQRNEKSVIGALLLEWNNPDQVMSTGARWNTLFGGWRHPRNLTAWKVPGQAWDVEIIVGNCVLYPTKAIKDVGLMDEKRNRMWGDAEYTPRMRRAGWKLLIETSAYIWCQPNTIPPPLHTLSFRDRVRALIYDQKNGYNMIKDLRSYWSGAPTHWKGLLAYSIRFLRLALHGLKLGGDWPYWPDDDFFVPKGTVALNREDFARALDTVKLLLEKPADKTPAL